MTQKKFHDPENRLRQVLKGQWGLFLRGEISLEGNFSSSELREIADIVDALQSQKTELLEIDRDPDWDENDTEE